MHFSSFLKGFDEKLPQTREYAYKERRYDVENWCDHIFLRSSLQNDKN